MTTRQDKDVVAVVDASRRRRVAVAVVACVVGLLVLAVGSEPLERGAGGGVAVSPATVAGGGGASVRVRARDAGVRGRGPLRVFSGRVLPRPVAGPVALSERAIDRVRGYTPWVSAGGRRRKLVALTFDDGPGPSTVAIVRTLRRLRVPATFFPVGQMMRARPRVARMVERTFAVGDHTHSHPELAGLGPRGQAREILRQTVRMQAAGGRFPRMFRPPYASFDRATLSVLRRWRMLMVLWSVDSEDYRLPGHRRIASGVLQRIHPGAIVLMHDGGGPRGQTAASLPLIVRALRRRGYRFVTVPRMLREAPPARRQKLPPGVLMRR